MKNVRCCIKCKTRKQKEELFRIAIENQIAVLDEKQNIDSRGMYICKNKDCIEKYIKGLEKGKVNFKIKIKHDSIIEVLKSLLFRMGE